MLTVLSQNKQVLFPINVPITIEKSVGKDAKGYFSVVGWFGEKGIILGKYNNQGRAIDVLNNIYIYLSEKSYYTMPKE